MNIKTLGIIEENANCSPSGDKINNESFIFISEKLQYTKKAWKKINKLIKMNNDNKSIGFRYKPTI